MSKIRIVCPSCFPNQDWSKLEVLGSMLWLWHYDDMRQDATLPKIMGFLMPPIKLGQFIAFYEADKPIGYISWANFNSTVEDLYIQSHFNLLDDNQYWNCGDRTWIIDYFAPFGHQKKILNLAKRLFPRAVVRSFAHKETQYKEKNVNLYRGVDVTRDEMNNWNKKHPLTT